MQIFQLLRVSGQPYMHGGGGEERQRVREHPEREKQGPGLMGVLVRVRVLFPDSIADPGQSLPLEQHLENFKVGTPKLREPLGSYPS